MPGGSSRKGTLHAAWAYCFHPETGAAAPGIRGNLPSGLFEPIRARCRAACYRKAERPTTLSVIDRSGRAVAPSTGLLPQPLRTNRFRGFGIRPNTQPTAAFPTMSRTERWLRMRLPMTPVAAPQPQCTSA